MVDGIIENKYPLAYTEIKLIVPVHDLCPITHEPLEGSTLTIEYKPSKIHKRFLRMRIIYEWIKDLQKEPLDLETFIQKIGIEISNQLMTNVHARGVFLLSRFIILIVDYDSSKTYLLRRQE
jgi:hypothetical protein